ncbi:hypothetical protein M231_07102 [Tremella mesenterica]|uniref:MARVEL domain-containing protein n=1 Tax=Tremella mesenterica TaxID=5217 RepID=A0A4Q1BA33_TREME|nr:hypothetical protein M231_07102 [Tremella mesenterica]
MRFSRSTAGNKLSKAFRFDKNLNVLRQSEMGDPFTDGPVLEQPSLPRTHLILYCASLFLTFLAICTMGGVAGFQAKWFKISGGVGFTLFILLLTFLMTCFLLLTPLVYDRWDKMKRPAKFLAEPRSTLILHTFGTGLVLLAAMITTISGWGDKGCKNADNDPHAGLGDSYKKALPQWLGLAIYLALLVLAGLAFRRDRSSTRHREPAFIPPSDTYGPGVGPASYSSVRPEDDPYADKHEFSQLPGQPQTRQMSYQPTPVDQVQQSYSAPIQESYDPPVPVADYGGSVTRPSVDTYGGYDGDLSGGMGQSRTMKMAYTDPYAQIRASLLSEPPSGGYALPQAQPGYTLPQPPTYGGYR